jgi:hypothetical protein
MTEDDRAASLWVITRYGLAWRYPAPRHRLGGLKTMPAGPLQTSGEAVSSLACQALDVNAGIMSLLQTFCSLVRLLEQHGVTLCPSGALSDQPKQGLAGIDSGVSKPRADDLSS